MATVTKIDTTPVGDLSKASLMNDVAGEDSMPPKFERFIRGKFLPDVIDVYVHNDFLNDNETCEFRNMPDRSTARRTIKFVRQYPKRTVMGKVVDKPDGDSLNELSTGQLDLRCSECIGIGHHSEVFLAPLTFPSTIPKSTIHGNVAVKLSKYHKGARQMLKDEAKIYSAFPRSLHTADVPIVPKFYGYYEPRTEVFDRVNNDNDSSNSDEEEGKCGPLVNCIGPILLLEACGEPVRAWALSDSGRMAIDRLLSRLHKANFTQGSTYERNVLVQPGPLNQPPANRSLSEPSYRIIDFGRGLGLGVNRLSHEDIKYEVEMEKRHARVEGLIP